MLKNSEEDSLSLLSRHNSILDTIRHSDIFDVKSISQNTNISWPTVKASLDTLLEKKVILANDDASKKYIINKSFCYSLGIAIGATETKIVLIDLSLMPADVKEHPEINEFITAIENKIGESSESDYLCYPTKADYLGIYDFCTSVIDATLDFFNNHEKMNLFSIGISLPGIIDKNTMEMAFCPNIPSLVGLTVTKLIRSETIVRLNTLKIPFYFCHDTVAATAFEKESLYHPEFGNTQYKDKRNIAVFYLGFGLGSGYIIDNNLVFGASGAIGELGHVELGSFEIKYQNDAEQRDSKRYNLNDNEDNFEDNLDLNTNVAPCDCGSTSCLEHLVRVLVFNSNDISNFKRKTTPYELSEFAKNHPYRYKVLKTLIGKALNITVNMLNVDLVILSGRILNSIPELKSDVEAILNDNCLKASSKYSSIINGCIRPDIVAAGAAIIAYHKAINIDKNSTPRVNWN